jgi:hypothetical protein
VNNPHCLAAASLCPFDTILYRLRRRQRSHRQPPARAVEASGRCEFRAERRRDRPSEEAHAHMPQPNRPRVEAVPFLRPHGSFRERYACNLAPKMAWQSAKLGIHPILAARTRPQRAASRSPPCLGASSDNLPGGPVTATSREETHAPAPLLIQFPILVRYSGLASTLLRFRFHIGAS